VSTGPGPLSRVRLRTSTGWEDIAVKGPAGPPGPSGPDGPTGEWTMLTQAQYDELTPRATEVYVVIDVWTALTQGALDSITRPDPRTLWVVSQTPPRRSGAIMGLTQAQYDLLSPSSSALYILVPTAGDIEAWEGVTQAEYDGLASKVGTTLYVIGDWTPSPGSSFRMVILNEADMIFLGDREAEAVYLGSEKVWPPHDPYIPVVMADNPVAFWPLTDRRGTTARDVSGNNHHGTYWGVYYLNRRAGPWRALRLENQTTVVRGGVTVPYHPDLAPLTAGSLEIWIGYGFDVVGAPLGSAELIGRWNLGGPASVILNPQANGFVGVMQTSGGANPNLTMPSSPAFVLNQWTHVVFTYDVNGTPAADRWKLYVQAARPAVNVWMGFPTPHDSGLPLRIGRFVDADLAGGTGVRGFLAYAAVYDYELTEQQIADHFAAGPQ
jgi:hypothetical protein